MKNIASMFSAEARDELKKQLAVELSDDHDYSVNELNDLYDRITDDFPYAYKDNGDPEPRGVIFEGIIDVFTQRKLIEFN